MRNKSGTTIPVHLTQRCNALSQQRLDLAAHLEREAPAFEDHAAFIRATLEVREVLPRLFKLRDAVAYAMMDKTGLAATAQDALAEIDAAINAYDDFSADHNGLLRAGMAYHASDILTNLRKELAEFLDDNPPTS